jgi:hypothetical protein
MLSFFGAAAYAPFMVLQKKCAYSVARQAQQDCAGLYLFFVAKQCIHVAQWLKYIEVAERCPLQNRLHSEAVE